ncbi:cytosolic carboxypeptidase 3-like [Stylophora pistillata]|uniref:cytosolic carboxypeptidase 3-like n=1 Tax=Stylophora pistillata TaxID=50429 RepID=UPI000C04DCB8|nr:cytosolic carboxypeptidase 3-like [Stylophora pistillata]
MSLEESDELEDTTESLEEKHRGNAYALVEKTAEGFLANALWRSKREEELHREIEVMSAEKAKRLFKDERDRKAWVAAIKRSVEQSIQSQVRAALGTPPGEKRKKLHEQRLAEERRRRQIEMEDSDKHRTTENRNYSYPSFQDDDGVLFQRRQQYLQKYAIRRSMRSLTFDKSSMRGSVRDFDDIDPLSSDFNKRFSIYTRAALENAGKTCSNTNTTAVYKRSPGCVWIDHNGEQHDIPGPFWPKDHLPRLSCQKHIHFIPDFVERLNTEAENANAGHTVPNEDSRYPQQWRGNLTVYERQNREEGQQSHYVPSGCPPCLTFESRFECGNLKQVKRIGSYEYDLILSCDLYTKRHTQWYYFRVQDMVPGTTYKFNIINLLKKDSLYNYGMKPLMYSERDAKARGLGWKRVGSHISYYKTSTYKNPLLQREYVYFTLTFHMEFPHEDDTCYLAHCYPYTYTDLELYLRSIIHNPKTSQHVQKEVLCKTMAGNNCNVLTVTSSQVPESEKLGVVVSARVHPGETNASWMMKGMLDFLTSGHHIAEKLRRKFVFKLVPMLNPDGVIVGNYRTNLAARDLNRTYKDPKKESFPTVWHMKNMLESFKKDHQVIIYCDLHGHSRKPNVFMYGCTADPKMGSMSDFVEERLFPWMMSQKAPDKFSFSGCKFRVRKCKESTARVVMWRQMGITNSFTMEATFCGANFGDMEKGRHFHVGDFEEMGRHFCEVLLEYTEAKSGNRSEMTQAFVELACKMTRDILRQTLGNFNLENISKDSTLYNSLESMKANERNQQNDSSREHEETNETSVKKFPMSKKKPVSFMDVRLQAPTGGGEDDVEVSVKGVHVDSFNDCLKILENLDLVDRFDESDSSDSDSEDNDFDDKEDGPGSSDNSGERKRKKKKKKKAKHWWDTLSKPPVTSETGDRATADESGSIKEKKTKTNQGKFVNPYVHRTNGGIPIFSQERIQERAKKREELQNCGSQEAEKNDFLVKFASQEPQPSPSVLAVTEDTELSFITAQRRVAYYMFAANKNQQNWPTANAPPTRTKPPPSPSKNVVELDSLNFDYLIGDGYGFTIRIPGRKPRRSRTQPPLQTFEEARLKPRKKQVSPAYAFDLSNEQATLPGVTPSPYIRQQNRYYRNDSEEEFERSRPTKTVHMRRGMSNSFDSELLKEKRKNFARSRSEHGMTVKSDDSEEISSKSAGHRPRNERPMFEPSAPIPTYSHVSSPYVNRKR